MIFSTLLSKATPWGDSFPAPILKRMITGLGENPIHHLLLLNTVRSLSGLGRLITVAKLSRAKITLIAFARCDSPSQRTFGRCSIRRSRLFTTPTKSCQPVHKFVTTLKCTFTFKRRFTRIDSAQIGVYLWQKFSWLPSRKLNCFRSSAPRPYYHQMQP